MSEKSHSRSATACFVACLMTLQLGCGRYLPPIAPELVAPKEVADIAVSVDEKSVTLNWHSPSESVNGQPLKSIDGYQVYRAVLEAESGELPERAEMTLLGSPLDKHIIALNAARADARAKGKGTRRLRPDAALTKFTYTDLTVVPGQKYAYLIVPFNQGGVEGGVKQIVKLTFTGATSETRIVPYSELESDNSDDTSSLSKARALK